MNRATNKGMCCPPLLSTATMHPDTVPGFRPPSTGKVLTNGGEVSETHKGVRAGEPALGGKVTGVGPGHPGPRRAGEDRTRLFTEVHVGRMGHNRQNRKQKRFKLDIRT